MSTVKIAKNTKCRKQNEGEGEDVSVKVRVIQTYTFIFYLFSHFYLSSYVLILVSTLLFFAIFTFDIFPSPKVERIQLTVVKL